MSLFKNFLTYIFDNSPEAILEKKIKAFKKEIKNQKPAILDCKTNYIKKDFVLYFFEALKPLLPYFNQLNFELIKKKGISYKKYLIESKNDSEQKKLLKSLEIESIESEIKKKSDEKYIENLKENLKKYCEYFNNKIKKEINDIYNQHILMSQFCFINIDYFFTEFDKKYSKEDPNYRPHFINRNGKLFLEELKEIHEFFYLIDFKDELIKLVNDFLNFRNHQQVNEKSISISFKKVNKLKAMKSFELAIKVLTRGEIYQVKKHTSNENIVDSYLKSFTDEKNQLIRKAKNYITVDKFKNLKEKLFSESESIPYLQNYNYQNSNLNQKKGILSYKFFEELHLIKQFFATKYENEIKNELNIIVVKGVFNETGFKQKIYDIYYTLNDLVQEINALDKNIAEKEIAGSKFLTIINASKLDHNLLLVINQVIREKNQEAEHIINTTIEHLEYLFSYYSQIEEQYKTRDRQLLYNITDFNKSKTDTSIEVMKKNCSDITLFLKLLKGFLSVDHGEDSSVSTFF